MRMIWGDGLDDMQLTGCADGFGIMRDTQPATNPAQM